MTQITRVPWGLQDFLGTQAQGKNPSELAQIVAPTVDMDQFLRIEKERWWSLATGPIGTPGLDVQQTVPDNEIWILLGVGFGIGPTGGPSQNDAFTFSTYLVNAPNSNDPQRACSLSQIYRFELNSGATQDNYWLDELNSVVAWAGSEIHWRFSNVKLTQGAFTGQVNLRYLQLNV